MLWWILIVVLNLNHVWGGPVVATEDSTTICQTEGCKLRSARILEYMDKNVNPCDDFYLFACGNFIKKSLGWIAWQDSAFLQGLQSFKNKAKSLLSQPISPADAKPIQDVKQIYNVCIEEGKDPRGIDAILDLLHDHGVLYMWPMNDDTWDEIIFDFVITETELRKMPYVGNSLLKISSNSHYTNVLEVAQPDLINKVYFEFDLNTADGKQLYGKMVTGILSLYGIDNKILKSDSEAIVDFETKLEKLIMNEEFEGGLLYSIKDIKQLISEINMEKLIKKMQGRRKVDPTYPYILVKHPGYLQRLDILLRNTPKRTIANYLFWHTILKLHLLLNKHLAAFNSPHKIRYSHPDWEDYATCEEIAAWSLPLAVSSLYMKSYLNGSSVEQVKFMAKNITEEITNYIFNNNWMDTKTRYELEMKSKKIIFHVASPEPLQYKAVLEEYYRGLNVDRKYLFDILIDVGKWREKQYLLNPPIITRDSDWRRVRPDSEWTSLLPSYSSALNMLITPEAMLQPPFFDTDVPLYSNYATLGYLIGSELVNGFHDKKMKYDINGKLIRIEDDQIREKAECFIEEYDQFEDKQLKIKMNGTKSLGQNIADNGGLKMAYNAYRKQKNWEPSLPELQQYDNYQMFMISVANMWCTNTKSHSNTANIFSKSGDTTAQFRVNGPLMNLPEFHSLFNCPEGSAMNPARKCNLW